MATLPVEYLRETKIVEEYVDGRLVMSFEVPLYKYFSRGEALYLSLLLGIDEREMLGKIEELKFGRKTVEKLWAVRLDEDSFSTAHIYFPDLEANSVDAAESMHDDVRVVKFHINGIRNFLRIIHIRENYFQRLVIYRSVMPRGIAEYLIYF